MCNLLFRAQKSPKRWSGGPIVFFIRLFQVGPTNKQMFLDYVCNRFIGGRGKRLPLEGLQGDNWYKEYYYDVNK